MAKRKTTVPPDEQDLESVGTEVLPPAEDAAPAEEDMAAAPDPSREIPVSPDEDSGLAGEGSPDGGAAQEDALLEESEPEPCGQPALRGGVSDSPGGAAGGGGRNLWRYSARAWRLRT